MDIEQLIKDLQHLANVTNNAPVVISMEDSPMNIDGISLGVAELGAKKVVYINLDLVTEQ